jgi:hypothetical protein
VKKQPHDSKRKKDRQERPAARRPWTAWAWSVAIGALAGGVFGLSIWRAEESVATVPPPKLNATSPPTPAPEGMAWVPGGWYWMGDNNFNDARPEHLVYLDGFWNDPYGNPDSYWWPWQLTGPPSKYFNLQLTLMTARAAELITPTLAAHPEVTSQIRSYMMQSGTTALVLSKLQPGWYSQFSDLLNLTDAEKTTVDGMDLTSIPGDPAFLFSYESLRMLSTLYSSNSAVTNGLVAKLNAAEADEKAGNLTGKMGQLKLFQGQVSYQTGHALSANQALVLMTLVKTL